MTVTAVLSFIGSDLVPSSSNRCDVYNLKFASFPFIKHTLRFKIAIDACKPSFFRWIATCDNFCVIKNVEPMIIDVTIVKIDCIFTSDYTFFQK